MTSMPMVSVITATLNSEKYLSQAIESVRMQTYGNIEHIIIDGASNDGTLDIIEKYKNGIAKVISEKDRGIYDAFNKGISIANGDIIYFLNSDDLLANENVIEEAVNVFLNSPGVEYVYGNVKLVGDNVETTIYGREFSISDFKLGYAPPHQAVFVKKKVFLEDGSFSLDFDVAGDFEFSLRCFLKRPQSIRYVNKEWAHFRLGGASSGYVTRMKGLKEKEVILHRYFQNTYDFSSAESYNNALYRTWFESILLRNKGVTRKLKDSKIRKVAIFGSLTTCQYLIRDLEFEGLPIQAIIDNNKHVHGSTIYGYPIVSLNEFVDMADEVDAIIVSVESSNDINIIRDVKSIIPDRIRLVSWKELVKNS